MISLTTTQLRSHANNSARIILPAALSSASPFRASGKPSGTGSFEGLCDQLAKGDAKRERTDPGIIGATPIQFTFEGYLSIMHKSKEQTIPGPSPDCERSGAASLPFMKVSSNDEALDTSDDEHRMS